MIPILLQKLLEYSTAGAVILSGIALYLFLASLVGKGMKQGGAADE